METHELLTDDVLDLSKLAEEEREFLLRLSGDAARGAD